MVMVVTAFNLAIALCCFYGAWQLWQVKRVLTISADAVTVAERNTHNVLKGAPQFISQGEIGTRGLRSQYQQLQAQWQKLEKILALVNLLQSAWQGRWLMPKKRDI